MPIALDAGGEQVIACEVGVLAGLADEKQKLIRSGPTVKAREALPRRSWQDVRVELVAARAAPPGVTHTANGPSHTPTQNPNPTQTSQGGNPMESILRRLFRRHTTAVAYLALFALSAAAPTRRSPSPARTSRTGPSPAAT